MKSMIQAQMSGIGWMPYVYQNEDGMKDPGKRENANKADKGILTIDGKTYLFDEQCSVLKQ